MVSYFECTNKSAFQRGDNHFYYNQFSLFSVQRFFSLQNLKKTILMQPWRILQSPEQTQPLENLTKRINVAPETQQRPLSSARYVLQTYFRISLQHIFNSCFFFQILFFFLLYLMQLFSADATILLKKSPEKMKKKRPKKLLIISPPNFFFQYC